MLLKNDDNSGKNDVVAMILIRNTRRVSNRKIVIEPVALK